MVLDLDRKIFLRNSGDSARTAICSIKTSLPFLSRRVSAIGDAAEQTLGFLARRLGRPRAPMLADRDPALLARKVPVLEDVNPAAPGKAPEPKTTRVRIPDNLSRPH